MSEKEDLENSNNFYLLYYRDIVCETKEIFNKQIKMAHNRFETLTELIRILKKTYEK